MEKNIGHIQAIFILILMIVFQIVALLYKLNAKRSLRSSRVQTLLQVKCHLDIIVIILLQIIIIVSP